SLMHSSQSYSHLFYPHSFPTRRSSDLADIEPDHDVIVVQRILALACNDDDGRPTAVAHGIVELQCTARQPPRTAVGLPAPERLVDRKSTRLNSSHVKISYAVFCLKKKK